MTGASSGMGRDFVLELLKEKELDEIWMIARRKERLEKMSMHYPEKLRPFAWDLTEISSFEQLEQLLSEQKPHICYLVNAAGAGRIGRIDEISYKEHSFVLDINVRALTAITKVVLPYMSKGSRIIQLCSASAFLPQPKFASYAASKSYVLSFSRALRQEVKYKGISVTIVCPGPVKTEFFKAAGTKISSTKEKFMAESKAVVRRALKDAKRGKELSIYGLSMKVVYVVSKILPARFILLVMNRLL